jgi:hypothetical protein
MVTIHGLEKNSSSMWELKCGGAVKVKKEADNLGWQKEIISDYGQKYVLGGSKTGECQHPKARGTDLMLSETMVGHSQ